MKTEIEYSEKGFVKITIQHEKNAMQFICNSTAEIPIDVRATMTEREIQEQLEVQEQNSLLYSDFMNDASKTARFVEMLESDFELTLQGKKPEKTAFERYLAQRK